MVSNTTTPVTDSNCTDVFSELEESVKIVLETYSNVHRGSGHNSIVTTHLFEQARDIFLEYLGLSKNKFTVIFCNPRNAKNLIKQLETGSFHLVSSQDIGLPLGVVALAVKLKALPKGAPYQTGGGTARLISKEWVIWSKHPDKFEAGTPAIINVIAFAKALRMVQDSEKNIFLNNENKGMTASEILYSDELEKYSGSELLRKLRQTIIGRGICVPTAKGNVPFINLDNSASTPTFTAVWDVFRRTLQQPEPVRQEIIREVKSVCSEMLGAPSNIYEAFFTSNATEAINLAAENFISQFDEATEPVVLNTLLEHSSNELPWRMIHGCTTIRLSVNAEGFVDLNELETLLIAYNKDHRHSKKRIKLVAISGASNVLGICQDILKISSLVHQYGAHLLVDAAQLIAHRTIDMQGCEIDYLAFSAHKVYSPFGSGMLMVKKELLRFNSAGLELIRSSGEENAGGIAALGKALVLLRRVGMDLIQKEEQVLTERTLRGLAQIKGLEIYGVKSPESPGFSQRLGVIVFALKNKMATQVGKELAFTGGIGVRTGCHCAHIVIKHILRVGPGLEKFQRLIVTLFPGLSLPGVVRVSLGIENKEEDIDSLLLALTEIAGRPQPSGKQKNNSLKENKVLFATKEVKTQIDNFARDRSLKVYTHQK